MEGGSSSGDHFRRSRAAEAGRSGARRKSGGGGGNEAKKKKTPQRGMGVAQLERLRLQADQQRLTMNNNNAGNPMSVNVTVPAILHHAASPIVFSPVAAAAVSRPAVLPAMINGGATPFQFPLRSPAASAPPLPAYPGGGASRHNLYGFGGGSANYSNLFHAGNVNENSKELSSKPNFTFNPPSLSDHHPQRCNVCQKKKRGNDGNLGYNQCVNIIGDQNQEYSNGLNSKQFLHGVMKGSCSSSSSKGVGMKEYEFFPAERNSSCCSQADDVVMMRSGASESSSPVAVVAAAMATSGEASFDASAGSSSTTTIDLSLRLSY